MLAIRKVVKEYNGTKVLDGLDLVVKDTDIIGLIGSNGVGKTTLLKILAGLENPDSGEVVTANSRIGYLPQDPYDEDVSVEELIKKYSDISNENVHNILQIMNRLGIKNLNINDTFSALSGGQKTKIALVTILLKQPNILILDEPTNNLDIEGLDWLENYIMNFDGGVILTSHDRYLLDHVCNRIIDLKQGKIKDYGGNYSFYRRQKLIDDQAYERMYIVQQKKTKKALDTIKDLKEEAKFYETKFSSRQPYQKKKASKSVRGAIVKEKRLEKELNSLQHLDKPVKCLKYGVDITGNNPNSKLILSIKDISFSYGNVPLFENVAFELFGSNRTWLKGKNGSGKSTLLKCITGKLSNFKGEIKLGVNIRYGYFSQDASNLRPNYSGIDELLSVCNDRTECYRMARHLNLVEEDLKKQINKLSSGQRVKLEYAKLLAAQNNLLILDEPTNHIDIETREEIEDALSNYSGAILVVSHDRFFIDKLGIDNIIELV